MQVLLMACLNVFNQIGIVPRRFDTNNQVPIVRGSQRVIVIARKGLADEQF
jgi:hypothetical protein